MIVCVCPSPHGHLAARVPLRRGRCSRGDRGCPNWGSLINSELPNPKASAPRPLQPRRPRPTSWCDSASVSGVNLSERVHVCMSPSVRLYVSLPTRARAHTHTHIPRYRRWRRWTRPRPRSRPRPGCRWLTGDNHCHGGAAGTVAGIVRRQPPGMPLADWKPSLTGPN